MCCNDVDLILGLEDKYMGNWNNIVTQISSVAMQIGMVEMHRLFWWPFQMMFHRYEDHVARQIFICLK